MAKTLRVILGMSLKLMPLFMFALAIGCDDEKGLSHTSDPAPEAKASRNTSTKEQQETIRQRSGMALTNVI